MAGCWRTHRVGPERDEIELEENLQRKDLTAFERSNRVELDASVTRSRTSTCPVTSIGGDVRWVAVTLAAPIAARTVITVSDREPVPAEPAAP